MTGCPICPRPHGTHEDDSYGSCTICREFVPHTDNETRLVEFPCAVVRLAAVRAERLGSCAECNANEDAIQHGGSGYWTGPTHLFVEAAAARRERERWTEARERAEKLVRDLSGWTHGDECAVWSLDGDDEADPYGNPEHESCDCGLRALVLDARAVLAALEADR